MADEESFCGDHNFEVIDEIGLTDYQMTQMNELMKNEDFMNMKNEYIASKNEDLHPIIEFIDEEYPDLKEVFAKNKSLLSLIVGGNILKFEENSRISEHSEHIHELDDACEENEPDANETNLTLEDRDNIQNVS